MGKEPRELADKALRLRAASRADDEFLSTLFLRKISIRITSVLVESRIRPNTVTFFSLLVGFSAAFVTSQQFYLAGGILLIFSLVLDCVDGEIARYKNEFSALGAWLDALSDRVKEFAYIFSLLYSVNLEVTWWNGTLVVILQTTRHLSDYNFARLQKSYEENSMKSKRSGSIYWIKKIIHLPIAERWILLAVLPLICSINQTIQIILSLGIISFTYALLTRFRRVARWEKKRSTVEFLDQQCDSILPLKLSKSRNSWLVPSVLRGVELAALLVISAQASSMSKFLMVTAVALWHYTNLYDSLQNRKIYLGWAGMHIAGRLIVIFAGQIFNVESFVATFLSIYLLVIILIRGWHNSVEGSK